MEDAKEIKQENKFILRPLNESLQSINEDYYLSDSDKKQLDEKVAEVDRKSHSWAKSDDKFFIVRNPTNDNIPAGWYNVRSSMTEGLFLQQKEATLDQIFHIPGKSFEEFTGDFKKFLDSKAKYKEYGLVHKRGLLMYGPPGCGKSQLVNLLVLEVISKYDGIVLEVDSLNTFIPMAQSIRNLEPDRPIFAIIEEFNEFAYNCSKKDLLNLLDGNLQLDNIVYLMTTNYLDQIDSRIKDRPSRVDRAIEMGYPEPKAREFFLRKKLKPADIEALGAEFTKWVSHTEGMSFAHLKELIISCIVMGYTFESTIERLKKMVFDPKH